MVYVLPLRLCDMHYVVQIYDICTNSYIVNVLITDLKSYFLL